jgi:hypothetical protein
MTRRLYKTRALTGLQNVMAQRESEDYKTLGGGGWLKLTPDQTAEYQGRTTFTTNQHPSTYKRNLTTALEHDNSHRLSRLGSLRNLHASRWIQLCYTSDTDMSHTFQLLEGMGEVHLSKTSTLSSTYRRANESAFHLQPWKRGHATPRRSAYAANRANPQAKAFCRNGGKKSRRFADYQVNQEANQEIAKHGKKQDLDNNNYQIQWCVKRKTL